MSSRVVVKNSLFFVIVFLVSAVFAAIHGKAQTQTTPYFEDQWKKIVPYLGKLPPNNQVLYMENGVVRKQTWYDMAGFCSEEGTRKTPRDIVNSYYDKTERKTLAGFGFLPKFPSTNCRETPIKLFTDSRHNFMLIEHCGFIPHQHSNNPTTSLIISAALDDYTVKEKIPLENGAFILHKMEFSEYGIGRIMLARKWIIDCNKQAACLATYKDSGKSMPDKTIQGSSYEIFYMVKNPERMNNDNALALSMAGIFSKMANNKFEIKLTSLF